MTQNDIIAGIDLSSLDSVTQAQLMAAINQAAPQSNIGFAICQAGASAATTIAQGANGAPDVTNNPRFARYIWLNTFTAPATPYFYNADTGNWQLISVSASAIKTSSFASPVSALNGVPLSLIKASSDYIDGGKAGYVLVVAANGKDVEAIAFSSLSGGGNVALSSIENTGKDNGKVITCEAGVTVWGSPTLDTLASKSVSKLGITNISPAATARAILRTNASLVPEWVARDSDDLLAGASITLDKLAVKNNAASAAGSQFQVPAINGSGVFNLVTPKINQAAETAGVAGILAGATLVAASGANTIVTIAHGLGTIPSNWRVVLRLTGASADQGYPVGCEIPVENIRDNGLNGYGIFYPYATNASIVIVYAASNNYGVRSASSGAGVVLDPTKWTLKIYAWV